MMKPISDLAAKAEVFRQMHFAADVIVLPNAWDHVSAALMASAGFPVIATSSAGIAFAQGYPDGERLGRNRMLDIVGKIAAQVGVPVTGDLEAGYGPNPEDVEATVIGAIEVGLVGCNIEDANPVTGKLFDFDLSVERIRRGRAAADKLRIPFVLNARADPFLNPVGDAQANFAESVRRANAYLDAGATCVFVPGPGDSDTIARLVAAIRGPLNILAGRAGRAGFSVQEASRVGVKRVSIGGSLMLATATLVRNILADIRQHGNFNYAMNAMTNAKMNELMKQLPSR